MTYAGRRGDETHSVATTARMAKWLHRHAVNIALRPLRDKFPNAYVGDLVPNGNQASRYLYRSARTALWVRP